MKPGTPSAINLPAEFTRTAFSAERRPSRQTEATQKLPFELGFRGTTLTSAPGTVELEPFLETIQETPASGTWRFYVKAVIDPDAGTISAVSVGWYSSAQSNTSTDYYKEMGRIEVTGGIPGLPTQFDYGPVFIILAGGISDIWEVIMI